MNIMCNRWKLTMAERVREWYKSIANLPDKYKTLLREAGDDTKRYENQLHEERKIIDLNSGVKKLDLHNEH